MDNESIGSTVSLIEAGSPWASRIYPMVRINGRDFYLGPMRGDAFAGFENCPTPAEVEAMLAAFVTIAALDLLLSFRTASPA